MEKLTVLKIALVLLLFSGCGSEKSMTMKYYVIDLPIVESEKELNKSALTDGYCEVRQTKVSKAFESNKIAYRSRSHELSYYNYHEWAIRPADAFTELMVNHFNNERLFKGVSERFWQVKPDYLLESDLFALEVVENNGMLEAHIAFEVRLLENNTFDILVAHRFNETIMLESKDLNEMAKKISQLLEKELGVLVDKCKKALVTKS